MEEKEALRQENEMAEDDIDADNLNEAFKENY